MSEDNKYTFENKEYRDTYRHTVSHILAQAVKRLYPEVKLAIGPSIDNGFYYDFDAPFSFTQEHLDALEAEMRKICKEKEKLERFELPRAEAIKFMEEREEPYKVELINDLPEDATISFYKQGEFTDLCAGPHLDSTGRVKGNGIKLTACNAAYWRGDSSRQTLQRIYSASVSTSNRCTAGKDRLSIKQHCTKPTVAGLTSAFYRIAVMFSAKIQKNHICIYGICYHFPVQCYLYIHQICSPFHASNALFTSTRQITLR